MVELYVNEYDFNDQFRTIEEAAQDYAEGAEFSVVQITVRSRLTFKIIDGKPQMNCISMPTTKE